MQKSDSIRLENQVCFPLYALSKEITNLYRPLLNELDITYPQYLVMMVLWEKDGQTVGEIGAKITLDSGTVTPLLKRLESKKLLNRVRRSDDERVVEIFLTEKGHSLKQQACEVPEAMLLKMNIKSDELLRLQELLTTLLSKVRKSQLDCGKDQ